MEKCWQFDETSRCPNLGQYRVSDEYIAERMKRLACYGGCDVALLRASRWCLAHSDPDMIPVDDDNPWLDEGEAGA